MFPGSLAHLRVRFSLFYARVFSVSRTPKGQSLPAATNREVLTCETPAFKAASWSVRHTRRSAPRAPQPDPAATGAQSHRSMRRKLRAAHGGHWSLRRNLLFVKIQRNTSGSLRRRGAPPAAGLWRVRRWSARARLPHSSRIFRSLILHLGSNNPQNELFHTTKAF